MTRLFAVVLSLLLVSTAAQEQDQSRALSVGRETLARMGGSKTLTTRATGTFFIVRDDRTEQIRATLSTTGLAKSRIDFATGDTWIMNGSRRWYSDKGAIRARPSGGSLFRRIDHLPLVSALAEIDEPGVSSSLEESRDAKPHKLKIKREINVSEKLNARLAELAET